MSTPSASRSESKDYYEDFSLRVGQRDWLRPNRRHARLRALVDDALGGRTGLKLLDIGCGAGVMTSYLTKFGAVVGTDFSSAAIEEAQKITPAVTFVAGTLEDVPVGPYDAVMLFDVLEHIPLADRPGFLAQVARLIASNGLLFMSTPHPEATRTKREANDPYLQIIDEQVHLADVAAEAKAVGLELIRYEAYDVFSGSPEYQAMTFRPVMQPLAGPEMLTDPRAKVPSSRLWRARHGLAALRRGDRQTARWFLTGTPPDLKS